MVLTIRKYINKHLKSIIFFEPKFLKQENNLLIVVVIMICFAMFVKVIYIINVIILSKSKLRAILIVSIVKENHMYKSDVNIFNSNASK